MTGQEARDEKHEYQGDVEGYCVECGNERDDVMHRRDFRLVSDGQEMRRG